MFEAGREALPATTGVTQHSVAPLDTAGHQAGRVNLSSCTSVISSNNYDLRRMNFYEFLWFSRLVSLILEWILVPRFQGDSHTANSSPVEADALLFGPLPLGTNMTNWPTNQEVCQWNPCWLWRWVYLPASIRFHTKVYALQLRKGTPLTQALRQWNRLSDLSVWLNSLPVRQLSQVLVRFWTCVWEIPKNPKTNPQLPLHPHTHR